MRKVIFGKTFCIHCGSYWKSMLQSVLELYEDSCDQVNDVELSILEAFPTDNSISKNPSIFSRFPGGFRADFGQAVVSWEVNGDGSVKVGVFFRDPFSVPICSVYRRWRSREFPTKEEWFEQVLFELVLVPTAHFFPDLAVVHAAAVGTKEKCILLTGTGGVGKSSALLSVADNIDISFLADDIVVVDNKGLAYGNFAWPKIYGYNCEGNGFAARLLANRSYSDRIHFYLRKKINPSWVRRKIRPDKLFGSCLANGVQVGGVYFLFKESCGVPQVSSISKKVAVESTISIIRSEYEVFYRFIAWENYNALMLGVEPLLKLQNIEMWWALNLGHAYETDLKKVSIPFDFEHSEYQEWIRSFIETCLI